MGKVSFVHLSDLHYSKAWNADIRNVINTLIADLSTLKAEEGIRPSFVIFSGDLVHAGNLNEDFEAAYNLLASPVMKELCLEPDLFS